MAPRSSRSERYKKFWSIGIVIALLASVAPSYASNIVFEQITNTIEEARISVTTGQTQSEGIVTTRIPNCSECTIEQYPFDAETILVNHFGKLLSITDLKSWSGSRAMVRYRRADDLIEFIQILP